MYREFIINLIECESCGENTMITGSKHKCSYVHVWFGQTTLELHLMPDNVVEERSRCCKAWWIVWERCLLLFPSFISAKIIMHDKITKRRWGNREYICPINSSFQISGELKACFFTKFDCTCGSAIYVSLLFELIL